jgi:hypothetical protein
MVYFVTPSPPATAASGLKPEYRSQPGASGGLRRPGRGLKTIEINPSIHNLVDVKEVKLNFSFWCRKHIYENHLPMLQEQLRREPRRLPILQIDERVSDFARTNNYEPEWLEKIEPGDFSLIDYFPHAALTAPMAV